MSSPFQFIRNFFRKKITASQPNIWQKIFLLRKIYLTQIFRFFYSQFGEDLILKDFLSKSVNDGFFVDVGCYHPKKYSNTYRLYKRGWRGINIDLDELKIKAFNLARPQDCNITAAVSDKEDTVKLYSFGTYSLVSTIDEETALKNKSDIKGIREIKTQRLDEIIEGTRFAGRQVDLLSIDAEGHDLNVLKSLNLEKYQPKIIIIETHLVCFDLVEGSELYQFLKQKGYHLMNWVGFSMIFTLPDNPLLRPDLRAVLEKVSPSSKV